MDLGPGMVIVRESAWPMPPMAATWAEYGAGTCQQRWKQVLQHVRAVHTRAAKRTTRSSSGGSDPAYCRCGRREGERMSGDAISCSKGIAGRSLCKGVIGTWDTGHGAPRACVA